MDYVPCPLCVQESECLKEVPVSEMIDVKQVVDVSTVHKYWTSGTLVNVRWMWQEFVWCVCACVCECVHACGGWDTQCKW